MLTEAYMYKILIVEDDSTITAVLKRTLEKWGYEAETISDFGRVGEEFIRCSPDLVLLDISLPFFDGYYWCQEFRKTSQVPIIFISSASDDMNLVMAVNMGADDFIAKPFGGEVLIAKMQALLRRTYDFAEAVPVLEHRGAFLNTGEQIFVYQENKIELTKNEYRILLALMKDKGKVVSREKLMERLWETDSFVDENTLTVNVNRLRRKLEAAGLKDFIRTKFGVGYVIA